jgi:hypothetical protein
MTIGVIMMQAIFWSVEEVAQRAKQFYDQEIRACVEHGDNIGKMITIDALTGEYGIDKTGVETALNLKQKNPNARLFTMRIGYDVAFSFGGASLEINSRSRCHSGSQVQTSSTVSSIPLIMLSRKITGDSNPNLESSSLMP